MIKVWYYITSTAYEWPLPTNSLFSHGEGLSVNYHASLLWVGDFKLIIRNRKSLSIKACFSTRDVICDDMSLDRRTCASPRPCHVNLGSCKANKFVGNCLDTGNLALMTSCGLALILRKLPKDKD
uniref:SFRICE_035570 n=1 Tax=Spodoptera frugiperda TaxID=7108 RepID=A0A2H1VIS1_SPOFR